MIFGTGDTHRDHTIQKLSSKNFPTGKMLTKNDVVIIAGDFALPWCHELHADRKTDDHWLKWLDEKPFTTLFVDGNHENFDELYSYPIIEKFGGRVRKINDSVFHLMRGEIYGIDGQKIFVFGGAESIDKDQRTDGVSWWRQELPTHAEFNHAIDNLLRYGNTIDIVISHTCPKEIMRRIGLDEKRDSVSDFLQHVYSQITFNKWFFGHLHIDKIIDGKFFALYDRIYKIT